MRPASPSLPDSLRGRLVLDDRIVPGRLLLAEGRITEVRADDAAADGPFIAPGFVDIHVHGSGGHDAMGGPGALGGMSRFLIEHGVTSFLPTSVTAGLDVLQRFADDVRTWRQEPCRGHAHALGFHLEGPFLSELKKGAQDPAFLIAPADVSWSALEPLLPDLRLITVAPELPGAPQLIARLAAAGAVVSLGHSNATASEARTGYLAGARSTTHLFNAMSPVDHHAPGLAAVALADRSVSTELVCDGHHVDRTVWPVIWSCKPASRIVLVTDAISLAGAGEGRRRLGGIEVEVRGDRSTIVGTETLAGSVISLDVAVRNVVRAGVPLPAAVAAATRNPLRLLRVEDRGRLAPGQRADLVLLDDDLFVQQVLLGGEVAR